jgi:hypothetical protein
MHKSVKAQNRHVQIIGRFCALEGGSVEYDWPGVRAVLRVRGTRQVIVSLNGGGAYYNVEVDGHVRGVLCTHKHGSYLYMVLENLDPNRSYTVALVRRCDPVLCTALTRYSPTVLDGFRLDPDAQLYPVHRSHRRIELVGDSDLAALGVEADQPTAHNSLFLFGDMQNVEKGFGAQLARLLDAEYQCIAWSGKGVRRQSIFLGQDTILDLYPRIVASHPARGEWPSGQFQLAQVALIYCGCNDWISGVAMEEFVQAYSKLICMVAPHKQHIVCLTLSNPQSLSCIPPGKHAQICQQMDQGVSSAILALPPCVAKRVRHVRLYVDLKMPEDFALVMHWSQLGHAKIARALFPHILELYK